MIHAFLILDMDCFKQINDGYGHAVGDIVLQKFGQLLRDIFREDDIVGRIGGDEFVVVMKNIKMKEMAIAKAEELLWRQKMETAIWIFTNGRIKPCIRQNEVEKQEFVVIN